MALASPDGAGASLPAAAGPLAAHKAEPAFDEALLQAERPDVVLEVHLERQLTPDR